MTSNSAPPLSAGRRLGWREQRRGVRNRRLVAVAVVIDVPGEGLLRGSAQVHAVLRGTCLRRWGRRLFGRLRRDVLLRLNTADAADHVDRNPPRQLFGSICRNSRANRAYLPTRIPPIPLAGSSGRDADRTSGEPRDQANGRSGDSGGLRQGFGHGPDRPRHLLPIREAETARTLSWVGFCGNSLHHLALNRPSVSAR